MGDTRGAYTSRSKLKGRILSNVSRTGRITFKNNVTSWAGQHLHQLVRHTSLSHSVNQGLDVPETVDGSKLQQSFPVPLQSHLLEVPVPKKNNMVHRRRVFRQRNCLSSICSEVLPLRDNDAGPIEMNYTSGWIEQESEKRMDDWTSIEATVYSTRISLKVSVCLT